MLNSGLVIPPEYWNEKKSIIVTGLPPRYGDSKILTENLRRIFRIAQDLALLVEKENIPNPGEFVKAHFSPQMTQQDLLSLADSLAVKDIHRNRSVFFQIDQYVQSKSNKVSPVVLRAYRNMKSYLLAFQEHQKKVMRNADYNLTFAKLDFNFYEDFVDFLTFKWTHVRRTKLLTGLKGNTIGRVIKDLKAFIADRVRKKIIAPIDISEWTVLKEEIDAVYVNNDEISLIKNVDLSNYPHLLDYRDDFILGCLTGLRFSDFSNINDFDVRGGFLYKKQQKSQHWVVIPLRSTAKQILEKRFRENQSPPSNPEFNRHIKTVARLSGIDQSISHSFKKGNKIVIETRPKHAWITSHTCCRSFCTNEFLAGTPVALIMKISGHKSERDFFKYIRVTPEEAALKIQEIWKQRENS